LGRLNWGCGGFVPPHTQRFQGEILDTPRLAAGRFIVSLPPLAEQHRIVVVIESAFEQLDSIKNMLA
jgi:hypothetical protein